MEPFAPWNAPAEFFARKMEPFTHWDAPVEFFARKMEPMAGKVTSLCALDAS